MKIKIERKECTTCGSCWDTCSEVFEENPDDSFSQIVEKFRINGNIAEGIPDPKLEECAQDAADACPVAIIEIWE
ncbi:MAG: ferredoxin [Methanobacteriota archaeon]